jgi:Putative MetA-pathway of phenol degradation
MFGRLLLPCVFSLTMTCALSLAQTCPNGTKSEKLLCLVPQVYGINGIGPALSYGTTQGQFSANYLANSLKPVESSIARQSALLPLASPSAGITFSWDSSAKVFVSSTDSFGPIMGERAETIGKHRVFLGVSYQYFNFTTLDGLNLKRLPVLLTQPDDSATLKPEICSASSNTEAVDNAGNPTISSFGLCGYIRDVIDTTNRIDLKINQVTTFITFGLTNRIDLSVAIPIENIRMGVGTNATLVNNDSPRRFYYGFQPTSNCPRTPATIEGNAVTIPCLHQAFSNSGTASGIADITLRAKGTAWQGERAELALGADVRVPTGDQLDFLGAGAAGVKPFVVWSYRSRISPHAFVGYETNGSSTIGGDINTGATGKLPSQLTYSGGADVWLTKRITGAFDLVGQEVFQAEKSTIITVHDLGQCQDPAGGQQCDASAVPSHLPADGNPHQTLSSPASTYDISNASIGVKVKPLSNLLITGNVLLKLNDAGLRAKTVPLVGVSYTF